MRVGPAHLWKLHYLSLPLIMGPCSRPWRDRQGKEDDGLPVLHEECTGRRGAEV